ncbi:MAG: hypothetical protein GF381_01890 [Candidatus Pacebacteria bacterium]|nr:hypothetical protein [Candidatus Paceibacterota bacterium]
MEKEAKKNQFLLKTIFSTVSKFSKIILSLAAIVFLVAAFFYRLNYQALQSYDEAWYAGISRNILLTKNPFRLEFNQAHFTDHPPLGFILMAIPAAVGGSNELTARFVPALLGIGSIILIYLIGKKISGQSVGISAGAILLSSLWFMLRARSGNLDLPFFFWTVFTFYQLLHFETKKTKYFYLATVGLAALLLTKTLIGVGMIPVFTYYLWLNRATLSPKLIGKNIALLLVLVLPWYIYNQSLDSSFLFHHFFEIGMRGGKTSYSLVNLSRSGFYLQVGMGRWFKVFLLSAFPSLGLLFWQKQTRQKITGLWVWLLGFSFPLVLASSVEVWHLLPLYAPIALIVTYSVFRAVNLVNWPVLKTLTLIGFLSLAGYQFWQSANLFYPPEPQLSAQKQISLQARGHSPIYLIADFFPAAVYYSQEKVVPIGLQKDAYQQLVSLLAQESNVFIVDQPIVKDLERDKIPFQNISQESNYYLIKGLDSRIEG